MQAIILAGGFGSRLRPVIQDLPKPLAPVNGKPFLEYLLANLKKLGLSRFIFCVHYLAEKIQEYFDDGANYGINIEYSVEKKPLGTGGALGLLRRRLQERTFCVINADTYLNLDLGDCYSFHRQKDATATLALAAVENVHRYGQVITDKEDRVISFREKNVSVSGAGYINAGLYLLQPVVFEYIPEGRPVSLEKEAFPQMIAAGERVFGFKKVSEFFDIGIPEDYRSFFRWAEKK